MSQSEPTPSPIKKPSRKRRAQSLVAARDMSDPGDATLRNYRYQHTYGVMLLAAARVGLRPYVALWCEQHEDFLAERSDEKFDGYQIKTYRPENGAWRLSDRDLKRSIGRFVIAIECLVHEYFPSAGFLPG